MEGLGIRYQNTINIFLNTYLFNINLHTILRLVQTANITWLIYWTLWYKNLEHYHMKNYTKSYKICWQFDTWDTGGRSPRAEAKDTIWEWISASNWCKVVRNRLASSTLRWYTCKHSCSMSKSIWSLSSLLSPTSSQINYTQEIILYKS